MKRFLITLTALGILALPAAASASITGQLQNATANYEQVARTAVATGNGYTGRSGPFLIGVCSRKIRSTGHAFTAPMPGPVVWALSGTYSNGGSSVDITHIGGPGTSCNPATYSGLYPLERAFPWNRG